MQPEPCAPITLTDGNGIGADAAASDLEAQACRRLPIRGDSEEDRRDRCSRSEEENWPPRITWSCLKIRTASRLEDVVRGQRARLGVSAPWSVLSARILDLWLD